jgi:DNA-directed RNA polymerase alpha subunit
MADNLVSMPVQNTVSVGNLGLSVRAVNALKQAGIDTYDKLQELSWEELLLIPKLGQVTAAEIYRFITSYKKGLTFSNQDQIKVRTEDRDINIKVLNFGPRAIQGLKKANILTFGDLEAFGVENLLKIKARFSILFAP